MPTLEFLRHLVVVLAISGALGCMAIAVITLDRRGS